MRLTREIRDRRVALAKNVLSQLRRYDLPLNLRHHDYVAGILDLGFKYVSHAEVNTSVDEFQANSRLCIVGALLLSRIRMGNEPPMPQLVCRSVITGGNVRKVDMNRSVALESLRDTFDEETLIRIEYVFENSSLRSRGEVRDHVKDVFGYARSLPAAPRGCATLLCQNLIANDGELVVPAEFVASAAAVNPADVARVAYLACDDFWLPYENKPLIPA